jgi:hypothetical protein
VQDAGYHNATPLAHPHLLWLGDLIPVPGPLPNVLSIGDCIVFAGMLILLHRTCGRPAAEGARTRTVGFLPLPSDQLAARPGRRNPEGGVPI